MVELSVEYGTYLFRQFIRHVRLVDRFKSGRIRMAVDIVGKARGDQNGHVRMGRTHFFRQGHAVHMAGHDDVREKQIERLGLLIGDQHKRFAGTARFFDRIPYQSQRNQSLRHRSRP